MIGWSNAGVTERLVKINIVNPIVSSADVTCSKLHFGHNGFQIPYKYMEFKPVSEQFQP